MRMYNTYTYVDKTKEDTRHKQTLFSIALNWTPLPISFLHW